MSGGIKSIRGFVFGAPRDFDDSEAFAIKAKSQSRPPRRPRLIEGQAPDVVDPRLFGVSEEQLLDMTVAGLQSILAKCGRRLSASERREWNDLKREGQDPAEAMGLSKSSEVPKAVCADLGDYVDAKRFKRVWSAWVCDGSIVDMDQLFEAGGEMTCHEMLVDFVSRAALFRNFSTL